MDERDYKAINKELNNSPCIGNYIVFENSLEHEGLVQLSVILPTLEKAREYTKAWKNKKLYIYVMVE